MALYYKKEFKQYHEHYKTQKTQRPMLDYMILFTQEQMPGLMESMESNRQIVEFLQIFKQVVFCHRYAKNEDFLDNPVISFDLIRDPMYKYSKKVQDKFFENPVLAFIFVWFAKNS